MTEKEFNNAKEEIDMIETYSKKYDVLSKFCDKVDLTLHNYETSNAEKLNEIYKHLKNAKIGLNSLPLFQMRKDISS